MANWWTNNSGQNMLEGLVGDETNPAKLDDETIASFFNKIGAARDSYTKIRSSLLPAEQARIDALLAMAVAIPTNHTALTDAHQSNWNKAGIHTAGRYGGTRRGGNV